ncbi:hypothetical protein [Caballeronia temeraria]|uniref:hypothetical protein n=1 Tax=Caballeronia temeraria TaxID=1777137 RepID=UPI00142897DC|nr:hypothetical protein [Caballeronia temeraria]
MRFRLPDRLIVGQIDVAVGARSNIRLGHSNGAMLSFEIRLDRINNGASIADLIADATARTLPGAHRAAPGGHLTGERGARSVEQMRFHPFVQGFARAGFVRKSSIWVREVRISRIAM